VAVRNRPGKEVALMFGSLKLGKLFGIDLYVHGTFWLLPLFILFTSLGSSVTAIGLELLFVFAVFACVALHEVGHALAAAAYGIRTRDITLYPIGGVASLEGMPEKPSQEVAVALAGPAVNLVIAAGLFAGMLVGAVAVPWASSFGVVDEFVTKLFVANLMLFGFNLIPAFPMDGGRVLRALLSIRMTRLRATEVAVTVGTVAAIGLFLLGLFTLHIGLMAVAFVVWLLGQAELASIRVREAQKEFERRAAAYFGPAVEPEAEDLAARRFTGLAWDAERRVWVQWRDGVPVREIPT
jgi:Zn-dependent protease